MVSGRGNSQCRGLGTGMCWVNWRHRKGLCGLDRRRKADGGHEVRALKGPDPRGRV